MADVIVELKNKIKMNMMAPRFNFYLLLVNYSSAAVRTLNLRGNMSERKHHDGHTVQCVSGRMSAVFRETDG